MCMLFNSNAVFLISLDSRRARSCLFKVTETRSSGEQILIACVGSPESLCLACNRTLGSGVSRPPQGQSALPQHYIEAHQKRFTDTPFKCLCHVYLCCPMLEDTADIKL